MRLDIGLHHLNLVKLDRLEYLVTLLLLNHRLEPLFLAYTGVFGLEVEQVFVLLRLDALVLVELGWLGCHFFDVVD